MAETNKYEILYTAFVEAEVYETDIGEDSGYHTYRMVYPHVKSYQEALEHFFMDVPQKNVDQVTIELKDMCFTLVDKDTFEKMKDEDYFYMKMIEEMHELRKGEDD